MKKQIKTILVASCLSLLVSAPVFAGWQQTETGQWNYEQDGTLIVSQWVEDQGAWYYLGADGIMLANTTQTIDGTDYSFDASGRWLEPAPISAPVYTGINQNQYTNADFRYALDIPGGSAYSVDMYGDLDIKAESPYYYITVGNFLKEEDTSVADDVAYLTDFFLIELGNTIGFIYQSEVQVGEYTMYKTHCFDYSYGFGIDLYTYQYDHGFIAVICSYETEAENTTIQVLNTLKRIP